MDNQTEKQILEFWEKNKIYEKSKKKNAKGKKFYFLQGPPYTSGRLHMGHAWNNGMKDIALRYKRMQGLNVWDRAGYDMHGLPTENAVQKKLGIKDKLGIEEYGVEKFIEECIRFSSDNAKLMDDDLLRLGVWMDYENAYWPIKPEFIEGIWWFIKKAHEQKRLYKGKKIMQWCGHCETSLAKHELEYEVVKDNSIFLKFKIKNSNEYLVIWTTTPWTIPFNLGVMVNPKLDYVKAEVETKDGKEVWIVAKALANIFISGLLGFKFKILKEFKGKEMEGTEYQHPFYEELKDVYGKLKKDWKKVHTVILSEDYVDTSAGSGLVHCAPGCGPEDFEVGKKYGMGAFNNIDEKGYFKDMNVFNGYRARKDDSKFVELLKKKGNLIVENKIEHEYAHCWRCHNPIVFRSTEQWFLKIEDLVKKLIEFNKKVYWNPEFAKKNYEAWTENLKDNGLTRQRYWGAPMPIWECEKCDKIEVIGTRDELKKKAGKIPKDIHKPWIDEVSIECKCGGKMKRIKDVIDVWIDSGTASWNCLEYPSTDKYFDLFPAELIVEGTEQTRLWFNMLQICSAIAFGKSAYKNVYAHGMILDYQGIKMSKSLGNIISPYEVIDKYGADILRYYMCSTAAGENINFNWEDIKQKQRNLIIFTNISKYLAELSKEEEKGKKGLEEDYILSRKDSTLKKVTELMEKYRIDEIIREIENLYLDLSRVYIRLIREKQSKVVFETIKEVYVDILKMFSIVCPFVTEKMWQELREKKIVNEESVHLCDWPKIENKKLNPELEKNFAIASKIIELGLAERDKVKIGLRWPLAKAKIISESALDKEMEDIIARQLNVKKIELKKGAETRVELDTKMTPELEAEGFAREFSRKVQAERKNRGLKKSDIIDIQASTDGNTRKILEKNVKMIKERINAQNLSFVDGKNMKNAIVLTIKDVKINILLS